MNFFCSKDCPDLCGIESEKIDGKYTFKGVAEDWSKTGFICSKFKVFAEREIANGINSWQVAGGKKFLYGSSKHAVSDLATLLNDYKDKKILYMKGSGSLAYNMCYWDVFFAKFENCWSISGGPCDDTAADAQIADFGTQLNPDIMNLENADTIIVYGRNVAVCSQHLYSYLKKLKKQGKVIIYTDPVETKTAKLADKFIMINPCCDGLLACALLTELGHVTGHDVDELLTRANVSRDDFDFIIDRIKTGKVAHIEGMGLQRHKNGMNTFQWINKLAVMTGSEDMLYSGHSSKRQWANQKKKFKGKIHVDKIAEVLANGEFDLFVNVAANPVMTFPDTNKWKEALSKTKTLVIDTNNTETSAFADFFLKVGGMFAQKDFMGSYFFGQDYSREKLTKEMSDTEVIKILADEMKIPLKIKENVARLTQTPRRYQTGDIELTMPETSDKFQLITSSHHSYLNSQILPGMEKGLQVMHIHPSDAEKLGIKDGDDIKAIGETGEFVAEALLTNGITEKTVMCWKNIPMKVGFLNNAIPNTLTDSGNGLNYYTVFVDLEKV